MNKEKVYDKEIAPLMAQIIQICIDNEIPVLCSFSIPTENDDGLMCTTAILDEEYNPPLLLLKMLAIINPTS